MATTIKTKHSTTAGNVPSSLATGELAINVADGNLFYGDGSGVSQNFTVNTITAEQYIVSSSVTNVTFQQQSGSTIFGDSTDDTHVFTGSVALSTLDIDGDPGAAGALVDINNTRNGGLTADTYGLKVRGGDTIYMGGASYVAYGGYFEAGTTSAATTGHDTIALFAKAEGYTLAGDPYSYAAIFSGSGGTVGINTMQPTVELDVVGDISASNNVVANAFYGDGSNLSFGSITATGDITMGGSLIHDGDTNTKITFNTDDINLTVAGKTAIDLTYDGDGGGDTREITFNEGHADIDVRIEGDTDTDLFFTNAGTDRVGIGTNSPNSKLEVDGDITSTHITASGNISSSGNITCDNLTVATSITSVGEDVTIGDDLVLSSTAAKLRFDGDDGGGGEAIQYIDSGGGVRNAIMFPGSNVVAIMNRASDGVVQIRANTSTAGNSGEVTVATFEDDSITFDTNVSASKIDAAVGNLVYNNVASVTTTTPKGEIIKYGEADSAVSAGSIYMLHTDGKWKFASATVEVSSSGLLGVAVSNDAADGFLIRGVCDLVMGNTTPTGSALYLTVQDGRATFTPTSASGNVIRAVGYTLSGGSGISYFNPDATYIVAS